MNENHDYVTVHRLALSSQFRGQALGQQFLNAIFDVFSNYQDFRLDTHPDNHIMQHILMKLGFQACGTDGHV